MEAILRCVDTSSLCGHGDRPDIGLGKNLSIRIMQSQCIPARGIRPATRGRTIGSGVGSHGRQRHRLRALTKTSERTHADPATPTGVAAGEVAVLAFGYP